MDGIVLRENKNMLALARDIGFTSRPSADDPKLVLLNLSLGTDAMVLESSEENRRPRK